MRLRLSARQDGLRRRLGKPQVCRQKPHIAEDLLFPISNLSGLREILGRIIELAQEELGYAASMQAMGVRVSQSDCPRVVCDAFFKIACLKIDVCSTSQRRGNIWRQLHSLIGI